MAQWGVSAREVEQVFRRPDSVGVSYQTGRELRSAEIDGRLITLVVDTAGFPARVWTVWTDGERGEDAT
jgi:hypothetical protein